jgi:PKD repeat protein
MVFFNANYSLGLGGQIVAYTWNFGDGTPVVKTTSPLTNHDYFGSPSHWLVTLTVQDSYGMIDTISQQVVFYVILQFNFHPVRPFAGEPVNFNATANVYPSATTGPVFGWSFGDGTSATGAHVVHVYQKPAVYRVVLAANTSQGNASISKTIIVRPGIVVISKSFDGINVTVFANLNFNSTSNTVSGTLSVTAVNETSGMIIFQKTFNVTLAFGQDQSARLILATPGSVSMLGVTVILKESGAITAVLTRDPDVTDQGSVNIVDAATIALDYGTSSTSPNWHPASDLDGDGHVDILDAATMALDYGLPVFK